MSPSRFYALCVAGCLGGWAWIILSMSRYGLGIWKGCLIKQFFHISCPACGSTRAIVALLNGHLQEALMWNPLGIVLFVLLLLLTFGLPYDAFRHSRCLYSMFLWVDACLHRKKVFMLFAGAIIMNWWWIW
ncbi:hypothetical protein, membrane [gut metagenome]|uniref:DUF2752 domain-containing protein n=1 Tax=gut metagenome TaxID=749906 RepID=J9GLD8_9ZZZZ